MDLNSSPSKKSPFRACSPSSNPRTRSSTLVTSCSDDLSTDDPGPKSRLSASNSLSPVAASPSMRQERHSVSATKRASGKKKSREKNCKEPYAGWQKRVKDVFD